VGEAVAAMRDLNFKRLVVEDPQSRELIGIITQQDLIGVAYNRWAELMHHHALELREIIHVLENKTARLEKIAATDPLTGIANRARFEELLLTEQERHCRLPAVPFSVLIADIDRFKQINDTWGHNQGDIVLRGWRNTSRDSCVISTRWRDGAGRSSRCCCRRPILRQPVWLRAGSAGRWRKRV
jgi:FOG: GGDEF domain